jgi:hypothetical protein
MEDEPCYHSITNIVVTLATPVNSSSLCFQSLLMRMLTSGVHLQPMPPRHTQALEEREE